MAQITTKKKIFRIPRYPYYSPFKKDVDQLNEKQIRNERRKIIVKLFKDCGYDINIDSDTKWNTTIFLKDKYETRIYTGGGDNYLILLNSLYNSTQRIQLKYDTDLKFDKYKDKIIKLVEHIKEEKNKEREADIRKEINTKFNKKFQKELDNCVDKKYCVVLASKSNCIELSYYRKNITESYGYNYGDELFIMTFNTTDDDITFKVTANEIGNPLEYSKYFYPSAIKKYCDDTFASHQKKIHSYIKLAEKFKNIYLNLKINDKNNIKSITS